MTPAKMALAIKYYRARGRDDLADQLEAELTSAGRCRRCGRPLSDPVSIERGIGSDCWRKTTKEKQ